MNRLCWWCCHTWDGDELHMPYKIEPKSKNFLTMGQFCSWNCMAAYNKCENNEHKYSAINSLIGLLHKKMSGKLLFPKPSPSRYCLKNFGGTFTIDEFRKLEGKNHPIISFANQAQRVTHVESVIKLTFNDPSEGEIKSKLNNIINSNTKSDTLKLKRSKPLKRDINNLETMMGLVRTSNK
jgi:hypothetical protein